MRSILTAGALALVLAASSARAQDILIPTMPLAPSPVVTTYPAAMPAPALFPYSYPAAYPGPARAYVPYGAGDTFTFRGQPYGHAYDRFTFSTLGGTNLAPARYFYPPLR